MFALVLVLLLHLLPLLLLPAAADSCVLNARRGSFSPEGFSEQEGELSPAMLSDDDGTLL